MIYVHLPYHKIKHKFFRIEHDTKNKHKKFITLNRKGHEKC